MDERFALEDGVVYHTYSACWAHRRRGRPRRPESARRAKAPAAAPAGQRIARAIGVVVVAVGSFLITTGSSRKELVDELPEPTEPRPVVSLTRFRIQQVLGYRGRVLDPDDLPSYQFPWVACRLLSGAYRLVQVPGVNPSPEFRAQLQGLAEELQTQVCLAVDENHAWYFEPGKPCSERTEPPPRGGIWFKPARWTPDRGR